MFQLLLTDLLNSCLFLGGELLPHRFIHLDSAQGLGMTEHLHILKPLEWICQDIPFCLLVGVAAPGKDAVFLFHHQPGGAAALIIRAEVL